MDSQINYSFRSRWDRSTWLIIGIVGACCIVPCFLHDGWVPVAISMAVLIFVVVAFRSIHYRIDGNSLTVYQLFTHKSYPIQEIVSILPTRITTSAPAASLSHRLIIRFRRSPGFPLSLIISPEAPDKFISILLSINPDIRH